MGVCNFCFQQQNILLNLIRYVSLITCLRFAHFQINYFKIFTIYGFWEMSLFSFFLKLSIKNVLKKRYEVKITQTTPSENRILNYCCYQVYALRLMRPLSGFFRQHFTRRFSDSLSDMCSKCGINTQFR